MSGEKETPSLKLASVCSVHVVAVLLERRTRGIERFRRPAKVARDERDLRLRYDAPRARDRFSRPECVRRASEEKLRPLEITELRHRDSAQRKCRGVVAKRDAIQGAEWITRRERARCGRDQ
jgi:hypothetical protein